jgi:hypothetical protein
MNAVKENLRKLTKGQLNRLSAYIKFLEMMHSVPRFLHDPIMKIGNWFFYHI